jgi:hypothetical protein
VRREEVKMALNTLLNKAAATAIADAQKRYDAFVAANAKPLTMAQRVKGVVRRPVVPFDEYLSAYFVATQGRLHKCSFVARPRGRQMERHNGIRYASPSGECEEEEDNGRHYCHHPKFKNVYGEPGGYGTHYSKTYTMSQVEKLHKEDVRQRMMSSAFDIDYS